MILSATTFLLTILNIKALPQDQLSQPAQHETPHFRTALRGQQYHLYRTTNVRGQYERPLEERVPSRPLDKLGTTLGNGRGSVTSGSHHENAQEHVNGRSDAPIEQAVPLRPLEHLDTQTTGDKRISITSDSLPEQPQHYSVPKSEPEGRHYSEGFEDQRKREPPDLHSASVAEPQQTLPKPFVQDGSTEDKGGDRDLFTFTIPTKSPISTPSISPSTQAAPSVAPSTSPTKPVFSITGDLYYGNLDVITGPWPECIGWEGEDCKSYIESVTGEDKPNIIVLPGEGDIEFVKHRVRVFISVEGLIMKVPQRG